MALAPLEKSLSKTLNAEMKGQSVPYLRVRFTGSFVSVSMEDQDGRVTVRKAQMVQNSARQMLLAEKIIHPTSQFGGMGYWEGHVTMTWSTNP